MVIDSNIMDELRMSSDINRIEKAKKIVDGNNVEVSKVTYDNKDNFSIHAIVNGIHGDYETYISAKNGELDDVRCTCPDYESTYGTCKHILATAIYFDNNPMHAKLFSENNTANQKNSKDDNEKYRIYRQMITSFYEDEQKKEKAIITLGDKVKLEPQIIFNQSSKEIKVEFKIGNKQMYKIRNLVEFYDRMQTQENYKYGLKLEFIHTRQAFEDDSLPMLDFLLKYAEIIKYANESANRYYLNMINNTYILLSNSGIDDLFETLKGKEAPFETEYSTESIQFVNNEPEINFELQEKSASEFILTTKEDIFEYQVIKGKKYIYFLRKNKFYRCSYKFDNTVLKLLNIFRINFAKEIVFNKNEFADFYSLVIPKIKDNISMQKVDKQEIDNLKPKELKVKVFLDYNKSNFITADVKFSYSEIEFSPFEEVDKSIPRNAIEESKALDMFKNSGFVLDTKNNKLMLVNDDKIYDFLKGGIEGYISKFEVLATEEFKSKQISSPKINSIGVKIENNLLNIDLSNIDFDKAEINEIMKKYKLKKKFHRLKNGDFIDLEENDTLDILEKLSDGTNTNYEELISGELKLPIYRSLYLDKILKQSDVVLKQSENYKNLIDDVYSRQISDKFPLPENLKANLREYQQVGYDWLKTLDEYGLGGILADDMGLGKTVQVLTVILSYVESIKKRIEENSNKIENDKIKNQIEISSIEKNVKDQIDNRKNEIYDTNLSLRTTLVVCPSSLSLNWKEEAEKFTPNLKTVVISGTSEERENIIKNVNNYNIAITSYDLLKRDLETYKKYDYQFRYIIADEAQYIKNNNTKNARAIKEIKADTRYALTGTPIENSLSELWSIFDFIMPGYLFNYNKFKINYETPIAKEEDNNAMAKLKGMIEPFVLRRIKEKVLTELPDKTITVLNNEMDEEQLQLYLSYLKSAKKEAKEEIEENGIANSQIKILALLMRLRQICCHPGLFLENYNGESSKLNQCTEIINDAVQGGHKILLFSGYSSMFWYIEKELDKLGIKYLKLTGQTKVDSRMDLVNRFNNDDEIKVFLISLKAGGTGLNLIGADMVIHYDPWWNLSAENQATDRTYRIGQKRNVQVYKLITKNSIEEKIYHLQERKAKLANDMLSTKETFISKLSKDEIMNLFE